MAMIHSRAALAKQTPPDKQQEMQKKPDSPEQEIPVAGLPLYMQPAGRLAMTAANGSSPNEPPPTTPLYLRSQTELPLETAVITPTAPDQTNGSATPEPATEEPETDATPEETQAAEEETGKKDKAEIEPGKDKKAADKEDEAKGDKAQKEEGAAESAGEDGRSRGGRRAPPSEAEAAGELPAAALQLPLEEPLPAPPEAELLPLPRFMPPPPPPPAKLDARAETAVFQQTGITASEHHRRIRRDFGSLVAEAETLRAQVIGQVDRLSGRAESLFANEQAVRLALFNDLTGSTTAAYSQAKAAVDGVAASAQEQLDSQAAATRRHIWGTTFSLKKAVKRNFIAASNKVKSLKAEANAPFKKMLADMQKAVKKIAAESAADLAKKGAEMAKAFATSGGDALHIAYNEEKAKAAPELAKRAGADVIRGGEVMSASVGQQTAVFEQIITNLLNPISQHVKNIGEHGETAVQKAGQSAAGQLRRQKREAKKNIEQMRQQAQQQLAQSEMQTLATLRQSGRQMEYDIHIAHNTVSEQLNRALVSLVGGYQQELDRLKQSLGDEKTFVNHEQASIAITASATALQKLHATHQQQLQTVFDTNTGQLRAGFALRYDQARTLGQRYETEAKMAETQQSDLLRQSTKAYSDGMEAVVQSVISTAQSYVSPVEKTLADYLTQMNKELGILQKNTQTKLNEQLKKYAEERKKQINDLPTTIQPQLKARVDALSKNLSNRTNEAFKAMRGAGTEEGPLMTALRGVTVKQGNAIRFLWVEHHYSETIDQWLSDELSGSELKAARAYLAGNTAEGARWELDASMSWYGDDEARIEAVLRDLSDEDREKMKNLPGWKETEAELRDNLSGTDLDVTDALLAGKRHRADAYRLRDKINEARRRGDHDELHKILAGIPPEDLAFVQQEFAHIQGEVDLDKEGSKIDPKKAADIFATFVTRPVETYHQDPQGRPLTLTISGPNADLADALARYGSKSIEAKASRLAVETERKGGPKLENLEIALSKDNDPRFKSKDPKVVAEAEAERGRMLAYFAQKYGGPKDGKPDAAQAFLEEKIKKAYDDDKRGGELAVSLVKDGVPDPVIALKYAVAGAGTNEALIKRTLARYSREEIADIRRKYKKEYKVTLDADLGVNGKGGFFTELSGDEAHEVEVLLMGQPKNDFERLEIARMQRDYQRNETGAMGKFLMGDNIEDRMLKANYYEMERMVAELGPDAFDKDGNFKGDRERLNRFIRHTEYAAENYSAQIDRMANYVTTAIAIAGAVVAAVATGGAATPLLAAAIAGGTGLASMGANYALKGGRYGWEESFKDLGMTAVSATTAGVGAKFGALSKAGKLTGSGLVDATLIGAGSGFVNKAAETALTDGTWDRGISEGLGKVGGEGLGGLLAGGVTGAASARFEASGIGSRMTNSNAYLTRGVGKGLAGSLGGFSGKGTELFYDKLRGKYKGDIDDAFFIMLEAGGQAGLQGFAEGMGEAFHHRIMPDFGNLTIDLTEADVLDDLGVTRPAHEADPADSSRPPDEPDAAKVWPEDTEPAPKLPTPDTEPEAVTRRPTVETEAEAAKPTIDTGPEDDVPRPKVDDDTARYADELALKKMIEMEAAGAIKPDEIDYVLDGKDAADRTERLIDLLERKGERPLAAESVPDSFFYGGKSRKNTAGVTKARDETLPALAAQLGGKQTGSRIELETPAGKIIIDVEVAETPEPVSQRAGKRIPVATFDEVDPDNNHFRVKLSDRSNPNHIERALVHELAEIQHRVIHGPGEDVLRPGTLKPALAGETADSPPLKLSAHDVGRLAEIEYLAAQIAGGATRLQGEAEALVRHMGLVEGDRSEARLKAIAAHVGEDSPTMKAVNDLVAAAKKSLPDIPADPDYMDPDVMARVRQKHADMDNFQDWDEFQRLYKKLNPSGSRDYDDSLFKDWVSGKYINPDTGQPVSLLEKRVDPRFKAKADPIKVDDDVRLHPDDTTPIKDAKTREYDDTSIDDLLAARQKAIDRRDTIDEQLSRPNLPDAERERLLNERNKLIPQINDPTKYLGEAAARRFAENSLKLPPEAENKLPHDASGVPDLLYGLPDLDGRIILIEAKGGDSPLGIRKGGPGVYVQQGTRAYVRSLIEAMKSSTSAEVRKAAIKLETALEDNRLDYFLVRQPLEDGKLGKIEAAKFDISKGKYDE